MKQQRSSREYRKPHIPQPEESAQRGKDVPADSGSPYSYAFRNTIHRKEEHTMKRMKNVFVAVTAAACLLTSALAAAPLAAGAGLKGDVNLDGRVDITDLSCLQLYCAGYYPLNGTAYYNADVTGDGSVNQRDVVALKAIIMHWGE
jgi:hypothetical protein